MDRPGKYFSWAEFEASSAARRKGIPNRILPQYRASIVALCYGVLDPLREKVGKPIKVTSGFRTPAVNRAIGGAVGSQHMKGEAADIKVAGMTAAELAQAILDLDLPFDQIVWYAPSRGGHVHVSHAGPRGNRGQVLYAPAGGRKYVAKLPSEKPPPKKKPASKKADA